ncbi:MAG: GDP-mannose 4,6-dehydratase [Chloroflexota bacterium]
MVEQRGKERETILITGGTGFVGGHLIDYILSQPSSFQVVGLGRSSALHPNRNNPRLKFYQVELNDRVAVTALLDEVRPNRIFHLAAQSFPGLSFADPTGTLNNNLNTTLNLFEAVRTVGLAEYSRILSAGSGDQYGFILPEELPVLETNPFRPANPYAVSKITQEMLGYQYFRSYGLQIITTRAFNHLGPGQSDQLAVSSFARQLALIEAGQIEPVLKVGNLEARRDYTDVRDIVRGYWLALDAKECKVGEVYNLCSGQSYKMADILELLLNLTNCTLTVLFDPSRARPSDIPQICGDYSKFHQATGWQPQIQLEQSLQDLLDYWRNRVKVGTV